MKQTLKYLFVIIISITYCSTNQEIVIDDRYKITKAPMWGTEFFLNDSGSGLIFQVTKDENLTLHPTVIDLFLWSYPLDTVTTERKFYNVLQSMPSGGYADEIYLDYKIKNDPILISIKVDSTNHISLDIPPNTYYLLINSYYVSPNYLRDIIVKQGYWSIVKLRMSEPPVFLY